MSFLKISDPKKREQIVNEYLQTKKNIQQSNLATKTGDLELARQTGKLFKPIVETQKEMIKSIQPKALPPPQLSIEGPTKEELKTYGPVAVEYLSKFAEKGSTDKTYGLYFDSGRPKIGNANVEIKDNDLIINGKKYDGTQGLWELVVSKNPNASLYTDSDLDNYKDILINTNTMKQGNDPDSSNPKSGKSSKWKNIVSPVWRDLTGERRSARPEVVHLSSDPNTLIKDLDLLVAEYQAGNTGVANEGIATIDELRKQQIIDDEKYKTLNNLFRGLEI